MKIVFAVSEELGGRGFLLPQLFPLWQWRVNLISGATWSFWHAPTTLLHELNFLQHPDLGRLVVLVGCTLFGMLRSWLYQNTQQHWRTLQLTRPPDCDLLFKTRL